MPLVISPKVRIKLAERHHVTQDEIEQCFANRTGQFLEDTREDHATDPPTQWFISETDSGRTLKVVFIHDNNDIIIRTTYESNAEQRRIYNKYGIEG